MSGTQMPIVERIARRLRQAPPAADGRPFVTLSYAQSLDGSIAEFPGHPLGLSGELSRSLTHALRACHDAILVGIGTVLADNPALTVRYSAGESPQPVILDSRLRFPLYSRMLENRRKAPWIFTNGQAEAKRTRALEEAGAKVIPLSCLEGKPGSGSLDLARVLAQLNRMGIRSILVEGGAQVISSFLSSRHIDQFVITIAPVLIGGVRAFETGRRLSPLLLPKLKDVHQEILGEDIVVIGIPYWI